VWRLVTGNLVHWSRPHFFLDVGVFLILGLMFERSIGSSFPWLLVAMSLASGLAGLALWPPETRCRGLSGVDSGLFAAALVVEGRLALQDRARWLWVAPAAAIFIAKNGYELATGQPFFNTDRLLGPMTMAVTVHLAAIATAVVWCAVVLARSVRAE
jgi:rhomboid family GlyGly-CTERM serine protease